MHVLDGRVRSLPSAKMEELTDLSEFKGLSPLASTLASVRECVSVSTIAMAMMAIAVALIPAIDLDAIARFRLSSLDDWGTAVGSVFYLLIAPFYAFAGIGMTAALTLAAVTGGQSSYQARASEGEVIPQPRSVGDIILSVHKSSEHRARAVGSMFYEPDVTQESDAVTEVSLSGVLCLKSGRVGLSQKCLTPTVSALSGADRLQNGLAAIARVCLVPKDRNRSAPTGT
jgi:hypothetical protein